MLRNIFRTFWANLWDYDKKIKAYAKKWFFLKKKRVYF